MRLLSLHCTTPLLTVRREDTHSQIVRMQYIYIQRKVQHGFSFPPTARICCLIQLLCVRIFLSPDFHSSCLVTFSVTPSKCQRTSLLLRRQDSNLHEYLSDFVCYVVSSQIDKRSLHQRTILPERLPIPPRRHLPAVITTATFRYSISKQYGLYCCRTGRIQYVISCQVHSISIPRPSCSFYFRDDVLFWQSVYPAILQRCVVCGNLPFKLAVHSPNATPIITLATIIVSPVSSSGIIHLSLLLFISLCFLGLIVQYFLLRSSICFSPC